MKKCSKCGELVSGLHVPMNLQVISATDNYIKGNRITREELDIISDEYTKWVKEQGL